MRSFLTQSYYVIVSWKLKYSLLCLTKQKLARLSKAPPQLNSSSNHLLGKETDQPICRE